jgi:hypothetical protein
MAAFNVTQKLRDEMYALDDEIRQLEAGLWSVDEEFEPAKLPLARKRRKVSPPWDAFDGCTLAAVVSTARMALCCLLAQRNLIYRRLRAAYRRSRKLEGSLT